ncbi:MAG: YeeE/YedE family protein [Bdellovibrionales bacterium]|nr:YeeE/YedE family protein [Bdellovibrionales bacterium]
MEPRYGIKFGQGPFTKSEETSISRRISVTEDQTFNALLGGGLIGIATTLMLLFNGRVTGISGIIASSLRRPTREGLWRWMFLFGLIAGGFIVHTLQPQLFENTSGRGAGTVVVAGLLVGYGTVMGSGCTSGHGICGISRLSSRSIAATLTFMLTGFLAVQVVRAITGGVR